MEIIEITWKIHALLKRKRDNFQITLSCVCLKLTHFWRKNNRFIWFAYFLTKRLFFVLIIKIYTCLVTLNFIILHRNSESNAILTKITNRLQSKMHFKCSFFHKTLNPNANRTKQITIQCKAPQKANANAVQRDYITLSKKMTCNKWKCIVR